MKPSALNFEDVSKDSETNEVERVTKSNAGCCFWKFVTRDQLNDDIIHFNSAAS